MASVKIAGKRHLPLPKGPYTVGCTDIMTGYSKRGCFMRLYYPCSNTGIVKHCDQWPLWAINQRYIEGYAMYSYFPLFLSKKVFSLICDNVYIPTILDSPPLREGKCFPVIVFSHGISACRTTYSAILTELASQGYVVAAVEHRDHSACYTYYVKNSRMSKYGPYPGSDISKIDREVLDKEDDFDDLEKYRKVAIERKRHGKNTSTKEPVLFHIRSLSRRHAPYRKRQIRKRAEECSRVLDLLHDINDGLEVENVLLTNCELQKFQGLMDLSRVAIAGHSFGGATVLMSLAADLRFRIGLALDTWVVPIENEEYLPSSITQPIIFINTSRFQTKRSKKVLERFKNENVERRFVSIKGTIHLSQSDTPYMVPRGLNIFVGGPIKGSRLIHLSTTNKLMMHFIAKYFGISFNPLCKDFVIDKPSYIKDGIAIRRKYHMFL